MKKVTYKSLIIMGISLALFSCIKEDSLPTRYTSIPSTNTHIRFHAFSPDAPQVNFIVNGGKATAVASTTAGAEQGMSFAGMYPTASSTYASIPAGSLKIDATVPSTSTVTPGAVITTTTRNFDAGKYYSYFLADSLSRLSAVVVEDDPRVDDRSKAYFRVANFLANAPTANIEIVKTSSGTAFSKTFTNIPFKSVTSFEVLDATPTTYRVFLRHPTTNAKLDSITSFTPAVSKKYTIYARGVLGQTGSSNTKRPIISQYINF